MRRHLLMQTVLGLIMLWALPVSAAELLQLGENPAGKVEEPPVRLGDYPVAKNQEQLLPPDEEFTLWIQDETFFKPKEEDRVELRKTLQKEATTFKLENVVPPIAFKSGEADIPEAYVTRLRDILNRMKNRANVRLHFIGHTDNQPLGPGASAKYGDNLGLSRARAEITAEFFQRALDLPPEAISYDGVGDAKPIASNDSEAGRAQNRRVEVQVWYDEIKETMVEQKMVIAAPKLNRMQVCRKETVCKLSYKQGSARRAKLKNLVSPMRLPEGQAEIPAQFIDDIREVLRNMGDKRNIVLRFIGHTDNLPLTEMQTRIYGDHLALSKARARRVALAVQEALNLSNAAISSDGKGASQPLAPNDTMRGRELNQRVEVEFWYDDPFEQYSADAQACPEAAAAETITLTYDPPTGALQPIYFKEGQPVIPDGYVERLGRLLAEVSKEKTHVRLSFVGYTDNKRIERRTAMVYGDDIGLSTARARRTMEQFKQQLQLRDDQVEFVGRGYVYSKDVAQTGFLDVDESRVEVEILYDELAALEEQEGLEITRIEQQMQSRNPYGLNLMRITVDGEPLHDPYKHVADLQRCTDVALEKADIRFRYDNHEFKPRLNVTAWPRAVAYHDDPRTELLENRVQFRSYSNYPSFIARTEVRIFTSGQSTRDQPLAVIAINTNGEGEWQVALAQFDAPVTTLKYVLRVYDDHGRYDETQSQELWVTDALAPQEMAASAATELLAGYGENRLTLQNIPLQGGTITADGAHIPAGHSVWLGGRKVPVTAEGRFVGEEIIPRGLHTYEVAVLDEGGNGALYLRDVALEKNDWFYVGIGDITLVQDSTNGPAALVTGDSAHYDNDLNVDGRLAFYTHGTFGPGWSLTASADTREGPLDSLFSNFMEKSPDMMFRRLDPDYYYPTFGDDSTVEEGAPTMGKFYLKLQRQRDHLMWGNFDLHYSDTELTRVDRELYGAHAHYQSEALTSFGEPRLLVDGFAAEPGTLAGREEFRGTGGSLYFLRHQGILTGSERVRIEIRDKDSGLVTEVKNLTPAIDYDIDYLQGRIMLSHALASTASDGMMIDSGGYGGSPVYLVVRYEYTPGFDDLNDVASGGRLHYWFGDHVKVGLTGTDQQDANNPYSLGGVDLTLRKNSGTWLKLEASQSQGQDGALLNSSDGGFTFDPFTSVVTGDTQADAQGVEINARLSDLYSGARGTARLYWQQRDAGFSAAGLATATDVTLAGGRVQMPIGQQLELTVKGDQKDQVQALETYAVDVDLAYQMTPRLKLSGAVRVDSREDHSTSVPLTQEQGERVDLGVQAHYDSQGRWDAYGFAQATAETSGNREDNNRVGMGGGYRINDRLKGNGELSGGDTGTGAKLGIDYLMSDRSNLYLTYALENERSDTGVRARRGNLTSGARSRYTDSASVYVEERYAHGNVPTGLTHALGIDYAPKDRWNFGATLELGSLKDPQTAATTDRQAYGLLVGYGVNDIHYAGALEYRTDNTEQLTGAFYERKTWLTKNSLRYQLQPAWRLIGKFNMSDSISSQGEFYDGRFIEAVLGFGYRPITNDRWNTLFKYTYFYNVPTVDQVTLQNTAAEYIQKSHIIAIDTLYDLSARWSLGAKYAYRLGQLSQERVNPQFFDSRAHLYVLRADWHFIYRWDFMLEARLLELPDAQDRRSGVLVGMYRHFGKNFKAGVGYNFTDFSDDLTDLDYDSQGLFINLVAKF